MKNRTPASPILCALVLSLAYNLPLHSQAETSVSALAAASTPAAPIAPVIATTATVQVNPTPSVAKNTTAYTVLAGDSLTSIAKRFNTTRKKLKALNNLAASTVKPGQTIQVPSTKSAKKSAVATTAKLKTHHEYLVAQPVQDFDIPASTFASCPVPLPSEDADTDAPAPTEDEKPAPVAQLLSPNELAADEARQSALAQAPVPQPAPPPQSQPKVPAAASTNTTQHFSAASAPAPYSPHSPHQKSTAATASNDWGNRFLQTARSLGDQGIEYDEDWRPPGESHYWTMDCSNTTRYIYKVTAGIQLPRTASDQYYYLHLQGKAWDVPQTAYGLPDTAYLRQNLKPGDLLFWENTYRPERQPPITHVMVFLGTNDRGEWIMAGSQGSRGGEHNRRNGGPDIYVFRPSQPCGGYTTWMGLVHHQGRFCAFGRPLEADPAKLAVAEND
jgi:cell wall-associated NlpC family hydrolase